VFDELLAANYQGDRAGQRAFASALHAAMGEQIFDIVDLVAEGDAVVARFTDRVTFLDGSTTRARGFVHCRLADGKIVAQDVMTNPDMTPVLAPLLAPPTGR
jgi:ketosteroid isomerase-like protein